MKMQRKGKFTFKPGPAPFVIFLVVFALLLSLGAWQLERSKQKTLLIQQRIQRSEGPGVALPSHPASLDELRYLSVRITGEFDGEHQFLLDNQSWRMQPGYFVFTPFKIKGSDQSILVNRGWVPVGSSRKNLPDVRISKRFGSITGIVDAFPGVGYRMKGAEVPTDDQPALVQLVDSDVLSRVVGYSLLPYQVLLSKDHPEGYVRAWDSRFTETITPEKHKGYAVQWFSLALVLAIIFLWNAFKKP